MLRPIWAIGILLFWGSSLKSQTHAPLQGWWQVFLKHKTQSNWLLDGDAGFRVHSMHFAPSTALVRVGFGKQFNNFSFSTGFAWFESMPLDHHDPLKAEFRLYQKFTLPQKLGPLKINHICRAEERWLQQSALEQYRFQLRMRYQLQAIYQLDQLHLLRGTPYFNAHSEFFAVPQRQFFSQFRLFGAIGLNWQDRWRFEIGYLAVWMPATSGNHPVSSHALRMNLLFNL